MIASVIEVARAINDTARQVVEDYGIDVVPEHFTEWESLPVNIQNARIAQAVLLVAEFNIQTLEEQP